MTVEKALERVFFKEARSYGMEAFKLDAHARAGSPDRVLVVPGYGTVFVELKRTGEEPRPIQVKVHDKIRKAGGEVHVVQGAEQIRVLLARLSTAGRGDPGH